MSTSLSQQRAAIEQNNHAVSLIAAGEYSAAVNMLSFALRTYKQVMGEADGTGLVSTKTSLDQCMLTRNPAVSPRYKMSSDSTSKYFIYRQAIHIPLHIETTYQASVMASAMIIFNLALAHHLSAPGSDARRSKLQKSAKLYELGFNIQQEQNFDNNAIFTMATVNNMGVIHSELNDGNTARQCFEHLLSTVMLLVDCGDDNGIYELDRFLWNVTAVISNPCPAPAA